MILIAAGRRCAISTHKLRSMKLNLVRAAVLRGLTMAVRWFALGWLSAAPTTRRRPLRQRKDGCGGRGSTAAR